jgi:hypothetical protein
MNLKLFNILLSITLLIGFFISVIYINDYEDKIIVAGVCLKYIMLSNSLYTISRLLGYFRKVNKYNYPEINKSIDVSAQTLRFDLIKLGFFIIGTLVCVFIISTVNIFFLMFLPVYIYILHRYLPIISYYYFRLDVNKIWIY